MNSCVVCYAPIGIEGHVCTECVVPWPIELSVVNGDGRSLSLGTDIIASKRRSALVFIKGGKNE
jgi:hypothetical protein